MTTRALVLLVLLTVGCEAAPQIGAACTRRSECSAPLACVYGRCRVECVDARDCSLGLRCIEAAGAGACTLEVEERCTDAICASPLRCVESQCRTGCTGDDECVAGACVMGTCVEPIAGSDAGVPADAGTDAGPMPLPFHSASQCDTSSAASYPALTAVILGSARIGAGPAGLELLRPAAWPSFGTPMSGTTPLEGQVAIAAREDATDGNVWVAWIQQSVGVPTSQLVAVPIDQLATPPSALLEFTQADARFVDVGVDGGDFLGVVTLPRPVSPPSTAAWVYDPITRGAAPGAIGSDPDGRDQVARTAIVGGRSPFTLSGTETPPVFVFRERTIAGDALVGSVDRQLRMGDHYFSVSSAGVIESEALDTAGGRAPLWVARDRETGGLFFWDQRRLPAAGPPFTVADLVPLRVSASGPPSVAARAADPTRVMIAYPAGTVMTLQEVVCSPESPCVLAKSADVGSISGASITRVSITAVAEGFAAATLEEVTDGIGVISLRYLSADGAVIAGSASGATLDPLFDGRAELAPGEQVVDMRLAATPSGGGAAVVLALLIRDFGTDRDRIWLGGHYACLSAP